MSPPSNVGAMVRRRQRIWSGIGFVRTLSFWREVKIGGADGAQAFAKRTIAWFHDSVRPKADRLAAGVWNEKSRAVWMPWAMIALQSFAVIAICVYVGMAGVLYFRQRSMMYFPDPAHTTPAQAGLPEATEVTLTTSDGEHSIAWHVPPRDNKPVIVYFHGNGGALRYRAERFRKLVHAGVGLVALEYRGFGGNAGSPTEGGLIADGEAAYAFAAAHYPTQQIVLWGESLGTAIAVTLAAEKPVGRVILEAPFTSAAAVAASRYWYMPVRLLMKDQYRSDEVIGKVTAPVLILHGMHDRTVPFAMGERMFELTNAPRHIVRFIDGDHEDLDVQGALHAVGRFLAGDLDRPPHP
jgi:uncharacterized protein